MPTKIRTLSERLAEVQAAIADTTAQLETAKADMCDRTPPTDRTELTAFFLDENQRKSAAAAKIAALNQTLEALEHERSELQAELDALKLAEVKAATESAALVSIEELKSIQPELDGAVAVLVKAIKKLKAVSPDAYRRWMADKSYDADYEATGQLLRLDGVFTLPKLTFHGSPRGPGADAFSLDVVKFDPLADEKLQADLDRARAAAQRDKAREAQRAAAQQKRLDEMEALKAEQADRLAEEQRVFDENRDRALAKNAKILASGNSNFTYGVQGQRPS